HGPDIEARVTIDHPLRQGESDPTSLAEPCHDGAGAPETGQALNRTHQRIAIRRKCEWPVDDAADARVCPRREVPVADLERRGNAIQVRLEQLRSKVPRRRPGAPGYAGALVRTQYHSLALLAHVDLRLEVDGMRQLVTALAIEFHDLRHVVSD